MKKSPQKGHFLSSFLDFFLSPHQDSFHFPLPSPPVIKIPENGDLVLPMPSVRKARSFIFCVQTLKGLVEVAWSSENDHDPGEMENSSPLASEPPKNYWGPG